MLAEAFGDNPVSQSKTCGGGFKDEQSADNSEHSE